MERKATSRENPQCERGGNGEWASTNVQPLGLIHLIGCFAMLIGGSLLGLAALIAEAAATKCTTYSPTDSLGHPLEHAGRERESDGLASV